MTEEDEKYYADMFEMFRTEGWKRLVDEWQQYYSSRDFNLTDIKTSDDFHHQKGQAALMEYLLAFEESVRRQEADYEDEPAEITHA